MTVPTDSDGPICRLLDYIGISDPSYAYRLDQPETVDGLTQYTAEMTSQTWQSIPWQHRLTIVCPEEPQGGGAALLVIAGGTNDGEPYPNLELIRATLREAAAKTGSVAAMIECVPNQPLFDGMVEDEIVAFTFDQFLQGEGDHWPLLLPMVKSAVRAMDTVQAVARERMALKIDGFVLTGASKRGWTTWLTATADPRVIGIAPMVIDMLNLEAQMARQRHAYGGYSENIHDYTERSLQDRLVGEGGRELARIVDPYHHRDRLTMPKLICLGTNDPFWTVDAATVYFEGLPEKKWLHYEANAGHDLGRPTTATVMVFFRALARGASLPEVEWTVNGRSELLVRWSGDDGKAFLWSAHSPNRDFRDSEWTRQALEGRGRATAMLPAPEEGWTAYYVEVEFPSPWGEPYGLTTEITVLPDTFPHGG